MVRECRPQCVRVENSVETHLSIVELDPAVSFLEPQVCLKADWVGTGERKRDRQTDRQAGGEVGSDKDRQRQTSSQAGRQAETETMRKK